MERIAEWNREFRFWSYTVSYSQLLLRSVNVEGSETRIDVLFSNVSKLHLTPSLDYLKIDKLSPTDIGTMAHVGVPDRPSTVVFMLNDGESYIHATHCEWHEDLGGPGSPSKFGPLSGTK